MNERIHSLVRRIFSLPISDADKGALAQGVFELSDSGIIPQCDPPVHTVSTVSTVEQLPLPTEAQQEEWITSSEMSRRTGYNIGNFSHWNKDRPDLVQRKVEYMENGTMYYLYEWNGVKRFMEEKGKKVRDGSQKERKVRPIDTNATDRQKVTGVKDWYTATYVREQLEIKPSQWDEIEDKLTVYTLGELELVNSRQVIALMEGWDYKPDLDYWTDWTLLTYASRDLKVDHHLLKRAKNKNQIAYHYVSPGRVVINLNEAKAYASQYQLDI
mgnify:CR=1 FL=1